MKLQDIDPAFHAAKDFARATGGVPTHVQKLRDSALFTDGAVPARIKVLAALLWSVASRCEPCIKFYAAKARELGASDAELGEMLAVAPAMGACVAEMWALKAFNAAGTPAAGDCC